VALVRERTISTERSPPDCGPTNIKFNKNPLNNYAAETWIDRHAYALQYALINTLWKGWVET
jgi:hypothetical protein